MSAPVVSNSSPLIALERIGRLDVLRGLFETVSVPAAVVAEVTPAMTLPAWIRQRDLTQTIIPAVLTAPLGAGEREAISLALEAGACLVILDDRPARRTAQALSLPVIGTLGVLLAAKRRGLVPDVRSCLDELMQQDFRVSPRLREDVLRDAGEEVQPGA